jgi:hypothetical protein
MKDPRFPQRVQSAGWVIRALTETGVIAACPRGGCSLKVDLREGAPIPTACAPVDTKEIVVGSYEEMRVALRQRRQTLGMTIPDVEEIAGMASSHLAKAEKNDPSRIVGIDISALWAGALGYDIVLRPKPLTPKALRVLTEKRLNRGVLMRHG